MSDFGPVTLRRDGDVAVVTMNGPPVNALGHALRAGLVAALDAIDVVVQSDRVRGRGDRPAPASGQLALVGAHPQQRQGGHAATGAERRGLGSHRLLVLRGFDVVLTSTSHPHQQPTQQRTTKDVTDHD